MRIPIIEGGVFLGIMGLIILIAIMRQETKPEVWVDHSSEVIGVITDISNGVATVRTVHGDIPAKVNWPKGAKSQPKVGERWYIAPMGKDREHVEVQLYWRAAL